MKRLVGDEIPLTELEFYRHEDGRLQILIRGEHQNPIVQYNDYPLTRSYNGMVCPILNASFGGGGGSASGNSGAGSVAYGGSGGVTGGSGSGGACGSSDYKSYGNAGSSKSEGIAYSPQFRVPEGIDKLQLVVNDVEVKIDL